MNFTLEGRILKYVDENTIFMYRDYGNWKNKPEWCELYIHNANGYKSIHINLKSFGLHRILGYLFLGLDLENKEQIIDHIDTNRSNNKLNNLRIVTTQQNGFNRNAKGFSFDKRCNKFMSSIKINQKTIYLGRFNTEEEARQAYLDAKKIYHEIH
jgi:hypothetical protein